jgi:hypothetical protein
MDGYKKPDPPGDIQNDKHSHVEIVQSGASATLGNRFRSLSEVEVSGRKA